MEKMNRIKWLEKVEYVSEEVNSLGVRPKIVMRNANNGDLYLSVCPNDRNFGTTIRIERSGGASTRNPRLVQALTAAYDAIAGNEDFYFNGIDIDEEVKESLDKLINKGVGYNYNSVIKELLKSVDL